MSFVKTNSDVFNKSCLRWLLFWCLGGFVLLIGLNSIAVVEFGVHAENEQLKTCNYLAMLMIPILWILKKGIFSELNINKLLRMSQKKIGAFEGISILLILIVFSLSIRELTQYWLARIGATNLDYDFKFLVSGNEEVSVISNNIFRFIIVVFMGPFTEELLFRGIILNRLFVKWGWKSALFISSIVFGVLHGVQVFETFAFGMLMGILYIRTKTLVVPITFHVLVNMVSAIAAIIQSEWPKSIAVTTAMGIGITTYGLSLATTAILVGWLIYKNWPVSETQPPYYEVSAEL